MFNCKILKKTPEAVNRAITAKKNRKMAAAFDSVPFSGRVLLVPHCMRNIQKCKAKEMGSHYLCVECNACKIGPISKKSRELGYKALYILKGGKAIEKLATEIQPQAILGVACYFEGVQGLELSEKLNVPVQFVPLTKDGCVDTDVVLDEVFAVMARSSKK